MSPSHVGVDLLIEPATADHLRALIDDPERFQTAYDLVIVDGYIEFDGALAHSLGRIVDEELDPQWLTYLFIHSGDRALIGIGGFKGPPADGTVEIGYGIAPAYRNAGYATEAARKLVARAEAAGVTTVIAHTLGTPNPSTRILEGLGFAQTDIVEDPDEGPVWRWERHLSP